MKLGFIRKFRNKSLEKITQWKYCSFGILETSNAMKLRYFSYADLECWQARWYESIGRGRQLEHGRSGAGRMGWPGSRGPERGGGPAVWELRCLLPSRWSPGVPGPLKLHPSRPLTGRIWSGRGAVRRATQPPSPSSPRALSRWWDYFREMIEIDWDYYREMIETYGDYWPPLSVQSLQGMKTKQKIT